MEEFFTLVGVTIGGLVQWLAESGVLFLVFAGLWTVFGIALFRSHGSIDRAWARIRSMPLAVQLLMWLLFLPVMFGLWVWERAWPLAVRAVLILGAAGWNLLVFLPRALQAAP